MARTNRTYSSDADLRNTTQFAKRLSAGAAPITPESVNKLERGGLLFDVPRALAYETVLGMQPWSLADLFIYSARLSDSAPRWGTGASSPTPAVLDDLHSLATGHPLEAHQLLLLCREVATRRREFLTSPPWRELICRALLDAFGQAFERDERLLREALVVLDDIAVPYVLQYLHTDPVRYFNAIEAFGFMRGEAAWLALLDLAASETEGVQGQIIVESIRRWVEREPVRARDLQSVAPALFAYCEAALADPTHPYTAREESLALLQLLHHESTPATARKLSDLRDDLRQLAVVPTAHRPRDLVEEVLGHTGTESRARASRNRMPSRPPGLASVLEHAVYATHRVERLAAGMLLSSIPTSGDVSASTGRALTQTDSADYGVQRSLVRLLTKAGQARGLAHVSAFAKGPIADEGVRLSVAWALGLSSDEDDEASLARLHSAGSAVTRQVVALARSRRGFDVP